MIGYGARVKLLAVSASYSDEPPQPKSSTEHTDTKRADVSALHVFSRLRRRMA